MNQRIIELAKLSKERDLLASPIEVEYDPLDNALPEAIFNAKRIIEYILAQPVYITDSNRFTGMLRLGKANVPADVFHRTFHKSFQTAANAFYCKYPENLVTFEWQHSSPNYERIIKYGIEKTLADIAYYKEKYRFDKEKYEFEQALEIVCNGVIAWSEKCASEHEKAAAECNDPERKKELIKLASTCRKVPKNKCESFYEAVQCVILCFQFLPDGIGTLDRYMLDLYKSDIENGKITREEAKEYLQEMFVHISNHTPVGNMRADNSAECHFAIGGYTYNGEDGFNDLSKLIVEALMELDTRRPAISLRWTKKTPFEVLRFMLDCERNDKNKRIAFVNDEPRIRGLMDIVGLPYSEAIRYTMSGCNEPAFPGTMWKGGLTTNIVRSLTNVLYENEKITECKSFDEFFEIYRKSLAADVDRILWYEQKFNAMRAKDINVLSCFLLDRCIESGLSVTQGGCRIKLGGFGVMGLTCLIDSLTIIKQFVFEEKKVSMSELVNALKNNWAGYEELHTDIIKNGRFFGNSDEMSDEISRKISDELYALTKDRHFAQGEKILIGTLTGYNPHYAAYGANTKATPDGRFAGEAFMVGTGQARGKDRNGLASLMASVAQSNPSYIFTGPVVVNMLVEETVIRDDNQFEKFCKMVETYFKLGGLHVQLNYVSKEELKRARECPAEYQALKVRVSGFSAPYVKLDERIQDEIYNRTTTK